MEKNIRLWMDRKHAPAALLSGLVVVAALACSLFDRIAGQGTAAPEPVLLNEVLFFPAAGADAFVELKSTGRSSLDGLTLTNQAGEHFPLPSGTEQLTADRYLLIIFDGANRVEGDVVHADSSEFLNPDSGSLELTDSQGNVLDRVAWGADRPASVNLSRGGDISDLEPGTSIGRFPLSIAIDPLEWTIFSPAQVTPGAANPQPGVEIMIPLNGAVVGRLSFELSWYPSPGAVEYRVQVSPNETFSALTIDQVVADPALNVELVPGSYFWRVQAVPASGPAADFSPAQSITVTPGSSSLHLALPLRQASLAVPMIKQRKDSRMLMLELPREEGEHAWDVAHPDLDRTDPADSMNCALASVAMLNAFLGGDLSQDRIGYEVFHDTLPGPEWDLNYGRGLTPSQTQQALIFALDAEPTFRPAPVTPDMLWGDVQFEIDLGRPILASMRPGHALVITGYYEDSTTRFVLVNDPWWGAYAVAVDRIDWKYYWLISDASIPVLAEPELEMDSDNDGIVDFDENQRFGTGVNDDDSDKDDLKDKDDLRSSIFDEQWGYALASLAVFGRDYDGDGIKMELDEDSDGGGCFDGMEDFDLDGKFTEPETHNFNEKDDACFWGTDEIYLENTWRTDDGSHHQILRTIATFSLRAVEGGKLEGLAQIRYSHAGEFNYPDCSGTHDIGTRFFRAELQGEFSKTPDGGTFVTFQATPDHGEPYFIEWIVACSGVEPPNEEQAGWSWAGSAGTLVDGVYDYFADMSTTTSMDEFWQKTHMEQGGAQ